MKCVRCKGELAGHARFAFVLFRNRTPYTEPWDSCTACAPKVREALEALSKSSERPTRPATWRIEEAKHEAEVTP